MGHHHFSTTFPSQEYCHIFFPGVSRLYIFALHMSNPALSLYSFVYFILNPLEQGTTPITILSSLIFYNQISQIRSVDSLATFSNSSFLIVFYLPFPFFHQTALTKVMNSLQADQAGGCFLVPLLFDFVPHLALSTIPSFFKSCYSLGSCSKYILCVTTYLKS